MNTPESVVGCSSCGALYTPGPGDRGVCLDCRRQAAAAQPRTPSLNTSRPSATPQTPTRTTPLPGMRVVTAQRRNYALYRNLRRAGIGVVLAGGLATGAVTQRQRITDTWTKFQRHGVSKEWAAAKHKAWELWVAIRSETPWPVVEERKGAAAMGGTSRSTPHTATATHTTQHHTQVASTTTKRKSRKRGSDINTPGSTP